VSSPFRSTLTLDVVHGRLERQRALQLLARSRRNADRIRRVAAGLPACSIAPEHCPLHNSEPRTAVTVRGSTTYAVEGG